MVQVQSSSEVTSDRVVSNRWEQRKLFGDLMLPDICLQLRSSIRGDCDLYYPTDFLRQVAAFLKDRVLVWTPCTDVMDASILAMTHYTIELLFDEIRERSSIGEQGR
jgi:hypothetical protein